MTANGNFSAECQYAAATDTNSHHQDNCLNWEDEFLCLTSQNYSKVIILQLNKKGLWHCDTSEFSGRFQQYTECFLSVVYNSIIAAFSVRCKYQTVHQLIYVYAFWWDPQNSSCAHLRKFMWQNTWSKYIHNAPPKAVLKVDVFVFTCILTLPCIFRNILLLLMVGFKDSRKCSFGLPGHWLSISSYIFAKPFWWPFSNRLRAI